MRCRLWVVTAILEFGEIHVMPIMQIYEGTNQIQTGRTVSQGGCKFTHIIGKAGLPCPGEA